ncbi:hypothetical protein ACKI16_30415 [Streptomyces scabiei]|uniref:hypothetical protein n=1 Tax=Streptomyces scabiei TaxID=1930 RepID=UPI0038F7D134
MMSSAPLSGGLIDDLEREDDERGPEPDETEALHLRILIPYASHGAGIERQPLAPHGGGLQCDTCGGWFGVTFWTCSACQATGAWRHEPVAEERPPLPIRPTPHERDGRDQPPAPVRPHPRAHHWRGSSR